MIDTVLSPQLRPRVEGDREDQILDGVLQVLIEVGYEKLTFDMVAAHVRASKATLYRRWPTKADLIINALDQIAVCPAGRSELVETGSLEGDLEQLACSDPEWAGRIQSIASAIIPAMRRDMDLTAAVEERFLRPRQQLMVTVLHRAQARGEIGKDADLELLSQILPALAIHQTMLTGHVPTTGAMRSVISQVLLPACRATLMK